MRLLALAAGAAGAATVFAVQGATAHAAPVTASAPPAPHTTSQQTVTVQPGDYLAKIAQQFDSTWQRIYDANKIIKNPNLIYPGEDLKIPGENAALPDRLNKAGTDNAPAPQPAPAPEPEHESPATATPHASVAPAPQATTAPQKSAPQTTTKKQKVLATDTVKSSGSVWDEIAQCESGGNWHINTGNGFYGGLQFTLSSWKAVGGTGLPSNASKSEQIMRAKKLQKLQGWNAWPVCSKKAGL
jgi:LysM repeat protein